MGEQLAAQTDGRLGVKVYPNGALGTERERRGQQLRAAPDQRAFILTRSGFTGVQRYATAMLLFNATGFVVVYLLRHAIEEGDVTHLDAIAAVIRRTCRFLPSVKVISSQEVGTVLRKRIGG